MTTSQTVRLRERDIERAPFCPVDGSGTARPYAWRDEVVRGLMVVFNAKSKTYKVQRDLYGERGVDGRKRLVGTRKVALGTTDELSLEDARDGARGVIAAFKRGEDPRRPKVDRRALTLRQAWESYRDERVRLGRSPRTIAGYEYDLTHYLSDWLDRPLRAIGEDREGVDGRHVLLTHRNGPYTANATMRILRAVYRSRLRKDPTLPPNPVEAVTFNRESPRSNVVDDLPAWWARVQSLPNPVRRDLHTFTLLTGMRRTAACGARFEHLDEGAGFLRVPSPKGGTERAFDLPLSAFLTDLLRNRRAENRAMLEAMLGRAPTSDEAAWVFPARLRDGSIGPVSEPKESGLPPLHTLRHTYATAAKAAGLPELDIKLLLNHKLPGVTGGYIHGTALGDHLRECQERVTAFLMARAGVPEPKENAITG